MLALVIATHLLNAFNRKDQNKTRDYDSWLRLVARDLDARPAAERVVFTRLTPLPGLIRAQIRTGRDRTARITPWALALRLTSIS